MKPFRREIIFILVCLSWTSALAAHGQLLSCHELYRLASQIEPDSKVYRSAVFNENNHVLAVAIGTVVESGYYYFGAHAAWQYFQEYRAQTAAKQLQQVRPQLAQQYCFLK